MTLSFISFFHNLKTKFKNGNQRSVKAKKNILYTVFIKVISILLSLLMLPITIGYVDADSYGVWLTLSSIVGWASFFNFGLNNGLRNKLTESLAINDLKSAQIYVSTTYALLTLIFIPLFILFGVIGYFLDWNRILNSPDNNNNELYFVTIIVFGYFSIRFILSTINIILLSKQMPAGESARAVIEQFSALLIIFILTKTTCGSLLNLALGLCIVPLFILFYFNIALFRSKYKDIRPKINKIDFTKTSDLLGTGFKFFIIQIASIIQFQSISFIIINAFTPADVTIYNVAFKYFGVLTMAFGIFMTPLWSAVTDAYVKNDIIWIKNIVKRYQQISLLFILLGIVMLIISPFAYDLWIGKDAVKIPFVVSFWVFVSIIVSLNGGLYCGVLNGISALKLQFYSSLISPIIFLVLVYLFIYVWHLNLQFLIVASIISNFNGIVIAPLQYYKVFIKPSKSKIWLS